MGPLLEKFERESVEVVSQAVLDGDGIVKTEQKIARLIPGFLNMVERRALIDAAMELYRAGKANVKVEGEKGLKNMLSTVLIKNFEHQLNEVHYALEKKAKGAKALGIIEDARANSGVFYMVSIHQKPADGHKPYQGMICIDRRWRSVLGSDDIVERVEEYLKEHKVPRLQDLMGAPTYLITRRNCRHLFVHIPTFEVLTTSIKDIKSAHPEVHDHAHRSFTPKQLYERKKKRIKTLKSIVDSKISVSVN